MMKPRVIRPLAVCIIRDKDRLLVTMSRDSVKKETFCRLVGGGTATWQKISGFKNGKIILYPAVSLQYL